MNAPLRQPSLAPSIAHALRGLRARIRRYVWTEGLLLAVAWLGVAFWISFAADRLPVLFAYDDPELWVRIAMLSVIAVVLAGIVYWTIFRRIFVALSDRSMAILIERRFREFDDALLTTVELHEQPEHAEAFNPDMLDFTAQHALRYTGNVPLADIFNPLPRVRNFVFALLAVASVVSFAVVKPDAFQTWFQRCILLREVDWPRYNHVHVIGDKVRKSPVGDDVTVEVRCDATDHQVPDKVRIIHQYADGSSGSDDMNKVGEELRVVDGKKFQYFTYTYKGLVDSVQYEVVGGDYRVRDYEIVVVDRPRFTLVTLDIDLPDYINRQLQKFDIVGQEVAREAEEIPEGSTVRVRCQANKPLSPGSQNKGSYVVVRRGADDAPEQTVALPIQEGDTEVVVDVPNVAEDIRLSFSLLDSDGISTKEPIQLVLTPLFDKVPEVQAAFYGVGEAITPDAKLPIRGDILDDYGVVDLRYRYRVEGGQERDSSFSTTPKDPRRMIFSLEAAQKENRTEEALDLLQIRLRAQQKQRDIDEWRKYAARVQRQRSGGGAVIPDEAPNDEPAPGDDTPESSDSLSFQPPEGPDESPPGEAPPSTPESAPPKSTPPATVPPMTAPPAEPALPAPPEQPSGEPIVAPEMGDDVADINLAEYALQPGQLVVASIKATDAATVGKGPYTGTSNEHILKIVTAEELRSLLAAKELNSRINLERVRDEFRRAKDPLDKMTFNPDEPGRLRIAPMEGDEEPDDDTTEDGEKPAERTPEQKLKDLLDENLHWCQRAGTTSEENRNELAGISAFFQALRQEYENNRLDTDEVKTRLTDGIINPLEKLHTELYPEFDDRLENLMARLSLSSDANLRDQALADVREQARLIHDTIVDVLAKMKEMENYNEVIRLLREILEEKNALIRETKKASQSLPE